MLVLTYHRIAAASSRGADFYTVTLDEMRQHLDALEARGFRSFSPQRLFAGAPETNECALTFDDGTDDHFHLAAPLLRARGWRGVFFVPTEKLDRAGRLTREQARQLAADGHLLGCHSHEHIRMDVMSDDEVRRQLGTSLEILRELGGRPVEFFAPPGGYVNERVRRIARELGLRAIRTMKWGLNTRLRLDDIECVPLSQRLPPARLARLLDGEGLAWMKTLYAAKEAVKSVVPLRAYERLRATLFPPRRTFP